jgi:AcrR family transcriptional regulator
MTTANQVLSKRAGKTRRLIIDNASRIFFQQGFRNVSVEELCRVVGVSKVTFYKYFTDRDALVETIVSEVGSKIIPLIAENLDSEKDIEQIIETHYNLVADIFMSKISVRMLGDIESHMPETWNRIDKWRRAEWDALNGLIKRAQREGSIRKDIGPKVMILIFQELTESFFRPDFLIAENLTLDQTFSAIKSVFLRGIMEPHK